MVNYDVVFHALSDKTRRDIIRRLVKHPLTVSNIAAPYHISLPAITKHINVLEKARLIRRQKVGRKMIVKLLTDTIKKAQEYLSFSTKYHFEEKKIQKVDRPKTSLPLRGTIFKKGV